MRQPNIIFIMADQLAAGFVGCYGSGVNSTPTLDRLSREGVRFDRSYCMAASCAPNRATILTGRSPQVHGVTTNNLELKSDTPTYAQILRENGYRTGGFGKFHISDMQAEEPADFSYIGFDEAAATHDGKTGPWLDWVEEKYPQLYETALATCWPLPYLAQYGEERGKENFVEKWKEVYEKIVVPRMHESGSELMYPSPLPKKAHQTTYITECGIDFMSRHLDENTDKPFCCKISYVDPHDPYDPPAPYDTMFSPGDMVETLALHEGITKNKILNATRNFHKFNELTQTKMGIKKLRALYHGSIRFIDDEIARIVSFIEEKNLWDNTILVFTTDHGDMMGDFGLCTKGVKHYDKGVRTPLIAYGKGISSPPRTELVSTLDFVPTFCDWAQIDDKQRPPLEGKSFAPLCEGKTSSDVWKDIVVESAFDMKVSTAQSIITDDGWRFTIYEESDEGEMFNLFDDPNELNNLYHKKEYDAKRIELYERFIRAYMKGLRTQQYRNLPLRYGKRRPIDNFDVLYEKWCCEPFCPEKFS